MSLTNQTKNQHLMWRAGFGSAVEQLADLSKYTPKQFYKALVKASDKKPQYINVADDYLQGLYMGIEEVGRQQKKEMTADEKKMVQQKNREGVRNLNIFWLHEMVNSSAQLREKIALFWHGHFACRNLNIFFQQGLLDVIRRNALGNFGTLLKEVSKNAAMLNFLNNQQNRKDHPNENFAREVMELFTLGRGNYTENDVKEAARAFTGWSATIKGDYIFRKGQHDFGSKMFIKSLGYMPIRLYATLNGDAAYVRDRSFPKNNPFSNRPLYGSGVGLDCRMWFENVFSFEYLINHRGERDLFFRIKIAW